MNSVYYTSLSGMLAASYGLQNTSNNIANMQSPGFKRTDIFYSSLGGDNDSGGLGRGVRVSGSTTNFSQSTYLNAASASDLAIVGQGFFVVKMKNGEYLYTRDGEFEFNESGILIDRHSQGEVQGYNKAGQLAPIHGSGPETAAGKATTNMTLKGVWPIKRVEKKSDDGNLPDQTTPKEKVCDDVEFRISSVFDKKGKEHQIMLKFKAVNPKDGKEWKLESITDLSGSRIDYDPDQIVRFSREHEGYLDSGTAISFKLDKDQSVNLQLGQTNGDETNSVVSKDTSLQPDAGLTGIQVDKQDGYGEGRQIDFSFDKHGQISYHYDNGQIITGIYIGLARFDNLENTLVQDRDNLFRAKSKEGCHIGRANQNGFGSIESKKIEKSNVDETTEFANIIILQRMFQACSQIMDIDKQLLQELSQRK